MNLTFILEFIIILVYALGDRVFMKKKRKLRKRLIIALSSVLTVTIALVLFCVISGFNPISFIMGSKGGATHEQRTRSIWLYPQPKAT